MAKLETLAVLGLLADGTPAFVVIDTALPCNSGHASIYAADFLSKQSRARKLRELLLPLLQERKPVEEVFQS